MGMQLEDGKGSGKLAGVSDQRLDISARSASRAYYKSRDNGLTFNVNSHDASAAAGTYIFYFKNDHATKDFVIEVLRVGAVETALWKIWFVTGTAAAGSVLTPTNMRSSSGISAQATVRGDDSITGLSTISQIANVRTPANDSRDIPFNDTLQIGAGDAIAVEYNTGTTGIAEVLLRGYFD